MNEVYENEIQRLVKDVPGVYTERGLMRKMRDDDARAELRAREMIPEIREAEKTASELALREVRKILASLEIGDTKRACFEGFLEGMTMKEIGEALGISPKCAWEHIRKTKDMIRRRFEAGCHDWYEVYMADQKRF